MQASFARLLTAFGLGAVLLAALSTPASIEACLGRPRGILEWGPALFRAVLAFHGVAAFYFGWRLRTPIKASRTDAILEPPLDATAVLALAVLSAAALAMRLWGLSTSLWLDEVLTVTNFIRPPLGEIISSFPFQNQHLLYSIAAHGLVALFGESAFTVRLPAVLLGVASIPALYLLGRRVTNDRTAMAATALMAFSYHHVWFSQNARGYSGLLLFAILSTWYWLAALRRGGRGDWTGYVICTVLGLGIHMTALFVTLTQMAIHGVILLRRWRTAGARNRALWAYILSGSITLQLYALALPDFLKSGLHEVSLPSEWTNPLWLITAAIMNFGAGAIGLAVVTVGSAVAAVGLISIARRNLPAALAFILPPVIGGAAIIASGHNLWPRFFFFAMGFLLLIAMEGGMTIVSRVVSAIAQPRWATAAATAAAALVVAGSALTVPRCYAYPKQDFTGARDWVDRHRAEGEAAVAVGTAALVYKTYYAPHWTPIENAAEFETLHRRSPSPWLVYTLPIEVRTYRPDIWQVIEKEYRPVKIFPGTLQGGGDVYVCRRSAQGASTGGTQQ